MSVRAPLRLVIDTNVVVAALLHPGRTPDLAITALCAQHAIVLVDARVELEYRSVIARAKFAIIPSNRRLDMLAALLDSAERITCVTFDREMIDEGDRAFVEVARSGLADALITGNTKHFPPELGVVVLSPAALLLQLNDA